MTMLVVGGEVQAFCHLAHSDHNVVVEGLLDAAVLGVNDVMAPLGIAADADLSLALAHRELHLIAVVPGRSRADERQYRYLQAADPGDGIDDLLLLDLQNQVLYF